MQEIINILNIISNKIWIFTSVLVIYIGIYFTIKLKGIQLDIPEMIKALLKKEKSNNGLNPFNTLMLSLAGRIGVGSIAGIALSIYLSGPGTIFWIWLIALISAPLTYAETYLGNKYKEKEKDNSLVGGPSFYIKKGLNNNKLARIYAIIIIICYIVGFISIQSNTITKSITTIIKINPLIIGIILSTITIISIFGGIKKISKVTSKIVPLMSIIYIGISIYIIIVNRSLITNIMKSIYYEAFNIKSFTTSFLPTLITGIQRGIFSNEAGIGTGAIASSSGNTNNPDESGFVQMLGTYITTFIICTSTAIIILTSNYKIISISDPNGIELASNALYYHLGNPGITILLILIFLFAFSTILSGYYYGETSIRFLSPKEKKASIIILKLLTIIIIFIASLLPSTLIWKFTDIFIAILCLINIYSIYKLRKEIKKDN